MVTPIKKITIFAGVAIALLIVVIFFSPVTTTLARLYSFLCDRESIKEFLSNAGALAPLVFMGIQTFQVLLAPIPGELTGFLGGYLFGVGLGFCYSTIGLTIGSLINFYVGQILGRRLGNRLIPARYVDRFHDIMKKQGIVASFALFVIPGFPKDYLSIFLGFSDLSIKTFLIISTFGRMPGTLMLSLQGAQVYNKNYTSFFIIFFICLFIIALVIYNRKKASP
ncbi:MAG: VTT domain-containing protein [Pseudomonadota bacterium]